MRAYGFFVYGAFLAGFVYFIGWVEGLLVPRTIDEGPAGPTALAIVVDLLLLGLFAAQHSVMARPWFKRLWTRVVPAPVERSTYVLLATAVLVVVMWLWRPLPEAVWETDSTAVRAVAYAVSFAGWGLVLLSTFAIDHADMFGLSQVQRHHAGSPPAAPTLATPLLYRVVRHPLYLGFLVAFWVAPTMSAGRLLFAAGDDRLRPDGGAVRGARPGRRLRRRLPRLPQRVPGLIPRLPKRRHTTNGGDMGRTTTLTSVGEGLDEIRGLAPDRDQLGLDGPHGRPRRARRPTDGRARRAAGGRGSRRWRAGTRGSGRAGSRCTRCTCPRTATPPTWCRRTVAAALTVLDEHAARVRHAGARRRPGGPGAGQAGQRAGGGPAGRLRGRVRRQERRRRGRRRGAGRAGAGGEPAGGRGGAVRRHPDQVLRGADPEPGDPDAHVVRRDPAGRRAGASTAGW